MSRPLVTGIGSLPHADPTEGAAFVLETADLPYLPQLPRRHPEEGMLVQWGDGLCGCGAVPDGVGLRLGAPPGPRGEAFVGARSLLEALPEEATVVKTQATGPVTLAVGLLTAGHSGSGLWDCVLEGLVDRIEEHLLWVADTRPGIEIMLILDEPALVGLRSRSFPIAPADVRAVLRAALGALSEPAGIHCCGDTDWGLVASLRPAWISWDVGALGGPGGLGGTAEPLAEAVMAGTRILWGVVPAEPGPLPSEEDLGARLRRVEAELVMAGASLLRLVEDARFSPACGLAGLTEDQAAVVAERVRRLAGELTAHG